jgi:hypothetical protein
MIFSTGISERGYGGESRASYAGFHLLGAICEYAVLSIGPGVHSRREITNGLRSCEGKLKHLGISAPNRSTLAYANEHRPWEHYQKVFFNLLETCRGQVKGKKPFRFKNKLVSLDACLPNGRIREYFLLPE